MVSLREVLEKRKTIILDKPAIKAFEELRLAAKVRPIKILKGSSNSMWQPLLPRKKLIENPGQVLGVRGLDMELESLKETKRREWRAREYPEKLIVMAIDLADEWTYKMSAVFTPPELREVAVKHNLPKGLEVAEKWITAFGEAAKLSKVS